MIDQLIAWDKSVFISINTGLQNGFFDYLCPFLRHSTNWYLLYVVVAYFMYERYRSNVVWVLLGAACVILISDQTSANLIKNSVQRLRPCNDPDFSNQVRMLIGCRGGYSFVSAHATNHFAAAMYVYGVWGKKYRWYIPVAICWAASISFSQIYVGVHYPLDVLCGSILGILIGTVGGYYVHTLIAKKIQTTA